MSFKTRCKICDKVIPREDQEKHLKRHNFSPEELKNSLVFKQNFERVK